MRHLRIVIVPLVLALLLPAALAEETLKPRGEKIDLKLNLKKGDKKSLVQRTETTSIASVQGQTFEMSMKMAMFVASTVEDVDAKKLHTMKWVYDRVTLDMVSPFIVMTYDSKESKKDGDNPMFQVFDAMIGESITAKVTEKGETKEIKGFDELAKKLEGKAAAGANLKQQLEGLKAAFEQFNIYPDKPIDIGDSWTRKTRMSVDANTPMDLEATYTLIDRKKGVAVIKVDGKIKGAGAAAIKGTMAGTLNMDEATGWVTGGETTMDLEGNANGADISVKGKTTISEK